ncbi:hypothetical protein ES703_16795 [subsurface metagenome]
MLFQVTGKSLPNRALHVALDFDVTQLALGLAFELWFADFDADNGGQSLPDILAGEIRLIIFDQFTFMGIVVQHPGQRRAEAGEVGATVNGIDAVGKAEDRLGKAVIVLERRLGNGAVYLFGNVYRVGVADRPAPVQMADEAGDAALKVKGLLALSLFVSEVDFQALVQVGHLANSLAEDVKIICGFAEYLLICVKGYGGAGLTSLANFSDWPLRYTLAVLLLVFMAVAPHVTADVGREGIDHRSPHPMQTTGNLIDTTTELGAGVQDGHHCLQSGNTGGGMDIYRYAPPVVLDSNAAILPENDHDFVATTCHGLVNAVVGDFID